MWNTTGNTRACSRPDSRKRRWSRRCLKTGSGGLPSVSRRQTASNTGSPGFTGAARCRGAEALFLSRERLGGILLQRARSPARCRRSTPTSGRPGIRPRGSRSWGTGPPRWRSILRAICRAPTTNAASGCRPCGRSRLRTTAPKRQRPPRCWGFYKRWRGGIRGGDAGGAARILSRTAGPIRCRPGTSAGRPGWPGSTIRVRP